MGRPSLGDTKENINKANPQKKAYLKEQIPPEIIQISEDTYRLILDLHLVDDQDNIFPQVEYTVRFDNDVAEKGLTNDFGEIHLDKNINSKMTNLIVNIVNTAISYAKRIHSIIPNKDSYQNKEKAKGQEQELRQQIENEKKRLADQQNQMFNEMEKMRKSFEQSMREQEENFRKQQNTGYSQMQEGIYNSCDNQTPESKKRNLNQELRIGILEVISFLRNLPMQVSQREEKYQRGFFMDYDGYRLRDISKQDDLFELENEILQYYSYCFGSAEKLNNRLAKYR